MPSEFDSIGAALPTVDGLFTQGTVIQVDKYSCIVQRFLSSGGHANVYFVTLVSDGSRHVLKHIRFPEDDPSSLERQSAEQEIPIMVQYLKREDNGLSGSIAEAASPLKDEYTSQLSGHPNIVALTAAELGDDSAYILMEYCSGNVLSLMNANLQIGLDEPTILHIFCDMCKAVAHMHYQDPPQLHRDLKVENILISGDSYKLCDFGSTSTRIVAPNARLSRGEMVRMEEELQHSTTLDYRAPEMVDLYMRRGLNEKTDIWALGVMLYKLCYFRTPFEGASSLAILNAEYSVPVSPPYSKQLRHIFQMTLREEPRERPTIYTLTTYVCALRGEKCLLENKYASPPPSPADQDSGYMQRDGGLGYVSAQPPQPPPRRYAASSSKYALSTNSSQTDLSMSDGVSDMDSGAIVPMRRGRPTRQNKHISAAPSPNAASRAPGAPSYYNKHASTVPNKYSSGTASRSPVLATKPNHSPPSALGICSPRISDETSTAEEDAPVQLSPRKDPRYMRMSVKAPDGRESMSVDFVQGAVFGSTRRTSSLLRRNPSAASITSSYRSSTHTAAGGGASSSGDLLYDRSASTLSRKSTGSLRLARSNSRSSSAGPNDVSFDAPMASLPGFVCQPLPPPPPPPPPGQIQTPRKKQSSVADAADLQIADMLSPLSLKDGGPQSPLRRAGAVAGIAAQGTSANTTKPQVDGVNIDTVSEWVASSQRTPEEHHALARLSTIAEAQPNDQKAPPVGSVTPVSRYARDTEARAPVKSIYAMTMDKLEDDARFSMLFDDQTLFDAKARFAAQRSSVYQQADSDALGISTAKAIEEAQKNWNDLPFDMLATPGREDKANTAVQTAGDDVWAVQPRRRKNGTATAAEDGGSGNLDIDSVLQRAAARNRRTLIAQNNRRSQYIFSTYGGVSMASPPPSALPLPNDSMVPPLPNSVDHQNVPGILQEDVDDGMRVLGDDEIDMLLRKMDMYNRELLSEQQKWYGNKPGGDADDGGAIDLQSLDRMIAAANEKMLREEQYQRQKADSSTQQQKQQRGGGVGTGILQNVISAAKSTFAKTTTKVDELSATSGVSQRQPVEASNEAAVPAEDKAVATAEAAVESMAEAESPVPVNSSAPIKPPRTQTTDEPSSADSASSSSRADRADGKTDTAEAVMKGEENKTAAETSGLETSTAKQSAATAPASERPIGSDMEAATTPADNPQPSTVDNAGQGSSSPPSPKPPRMHKTHTDTPPSRPTTQSPSDPLAEVRARLKKKQSSPTLLTAGRLAASGGGGGLAARAAFLEKAGSQPTTPPASGASTPKKQPKSVRNLVAMFEHT
ncbi:Ark- serine/threonine protein kinase [Coemansia sp. RSA 2559]|nr:Ark- serine/threonine protein kinase [Coemansia sp. RSA 2559]KAJ2863785.1 Ark- serine/threonine protein kinase [Coemansia erecta]